MNSRKTGALFLTVTLSIIILSVIVITISYFTGNTATLSTIANYTTYPIILGICLIFMHISGESPSEFFGFRKVKVSVFFLTILYFILIFPATFVISAMSNLIFGNPLTDTLANEPLPLMAILSVFCAPFFEELLFRGALFQGFRRSGRVWAPIILTSLLFGLFHGNVTQLIYTSVLGFFMALLVEASGSLWMSMLMHFLFNMPAVIIIAGNRFLTQNNSPPISEQQTELTAGVVEYNELQPLITAGLITAGIIAAGIAVLFIFLAVLVLRKISKIQNRENIYLKEREPEASTGRRIVSIPLIIGICLASTEVIAAIFIT